MAQKSLDWKFIFSNYWHIVKKHKKYAALAIFISFLMSLILLGQNFVIKHLVDTLSNETIPRSEMFAHIGIPITLLALLGVIMAISWYVKMKAIDNLDSRSMRDLKSKMFNHIIFLSNKFHSSHKTGSLISRLIRGASAIERLSDSIIFNSIPLIFDITLLTITFSFFHWSIALTLILGTALFIIFVYRMHKIQVPFHIVKNKQEDLEKAYISNIFTNVDTVKYFGKEQYIDQQFADHAENTRKHTIKYWDFYPFRDFGVTLINITILIATITLAIYQYTLYTITIGELVFVITAILGLSPILMRFMGALRDIYSSAGDLNDIFHYLKTAQDIVNKTNAPNLVIDKPTITFDDVTFGYGQSKKVIKNISFQIKAGEKIALVGHSGSGKSTIVKLLYRFYNPTKGTITVSGQNISAVSQESLRQEMTIVPQECILFDDTLLNNILFANPQASKKELDHAIRVSQLTTFIKSLPDKIQTVVGERGVKLSGGERQRVSIARAVLANKKIIVLDEATSALDSQTEVNFQKAITNLLKHKTAIVIAHRLSTIMNADRIFVIENGEIIESGSHEQLLSLKKHYAKLWKLQKDGFIPD